MQRAFSNRLLAPLREIGFTHLAVETVAEDPTKLSARGYPTLDTGTYTRDPTFGDLIRRALDLGYIVVRYEAGPEHRVVVYDQHIHAMISLDVALHRARGAVRSNRRLRRHG